MAYSYQVKVYTDGTMKKCVRSYGFSDYKEMRHGTEGDTLPKTISIIPEKDLTWYIQANTWSKLLKDAIDRDELDIIRSGDVFWIQSRHVSDRAFNLAIKETKRIFPCLTCLYDIHGHKEA